MPLTTVALNGKPIEDYGLVAGGWRGWLEPPRLRFPTFQVPGRAASVRSDLDAYYEPREMDLGVLQTSLSVAAQRTDLSAWYRDLQGELEISAVDNPNKVIYACLEGGQAEVFGLTFTNPKTQAVAKLVATDPFWYDATPLQVGASVGERLTVPNGDAPGRWVLILWSPSGSAVNPVVTLRHKSGQVLTTMTYTVTLAEAVDSLRIDGDQMKTWLCDDGVWSNASALLGANDTYPVLDPDDGVTLEVSSGAMLLIHQRGWHA